MTHLTLNHGNAAARTLVAARRDEPRGIEIAPAR